MAYFPFFAEMSGMSGLVIGGGAVALRKVRKLRPYGPFLTVVAPEICPELREEQDVTILERAFAPEDVENMDFVIAATDVPAVNRQAAELCRERKIPVNVADDASLCTFLFPALVKRGELSVGISTGGSSPTAAIYLKREINRLLPDNLEELLASLQLLRERIKDVIPEEKLRSQLLRRLFAAAMEAGRPLTEEEVTAEIMEMKREWGKTR